MHSNQLLAQPIVVILYIHYLFNISLFILLILNSYFYSNHILYLVGRPSINKFMFLLLLIKYWSDLSPVSCRTLVVHIGVYWHFGTEPPTKILLKRDLYEIFKSFFVPIDFQLILSMKRNILICSHLEFYHFFQKYCFKLPQIKLVGFSVNSSRNKSKHNMTDGDNIIFDNWNVFLLNILNMSSKYMYIVCVFNTLKGKKSFEKRSLFLLFQFLT